MIDLSKSMHVCCVPHLLFGFCGLTLIQAVQQIKSTNSDLEAERRQEEAAGRVQDQVTERSLLMPCSAAAKQRDTQF